MSKTERERGREKRSERCGGAGHMCGVSHRQGALQMLPVHKCGNSGVSSISLALALALSFSLTVCFVVDQPQRSLTPNQSTLVLCAALRSHFRRTRAAGRAGGRGKKVLHTFECHAFCNFKMAVCSCGSERAKERVRVRVRASECCLPPLQIVFAAVVAVVLSVHLI